MALATDKRTYVPSSGDEPLDPVQQIVVRMWANIIVAEIRAEWAAEAAARGEDVAADDPRTDDERRCHER